MEVPKGYFVRSCRHLKTNGIQCGSPALKNRPLCFFHDSWKRHCQAAQNPAKDGPVFELPLLEDADSIQMAIMQVTQHLLCGRIDPKLAGLLLYALQTASCNLRRTTLQPEDPQHVVIDPEAATNTCIGDHQWHVSEFPESAAEILEEAAEGTPQGSQKDSGETTPAATRRAPIRRHRPAEEDQPLLHLLLERLGLDPAAADQVLEEKDREQTRHWDTSDRAQTRDWDEPD